MNWWMDALRSVYGGGVFCALVMIGLNFFIIVGTNLAGSRLAWSMARDKAFPFSDYLAVVNKRFGIPLRAMLAIVVIDLVIGLIVLASDLAFESIISGGGVTLQVGYVTPVIILLVRGRKILPPHPNFDLGRWGYPINIISVCWSLIIIVMYSFPMVSRRSINSILMISRTDTLQVRSSHGGLDELFDRHRWGNDSLPRGIFPIQRTAQIYQGK